MGLIERYAKVLDNIFKRGKIKQDPSDFWDEIDRLELSKKIKIHAHSFSKTALDKIKKSGSEAIVIGGEDK